MKRCILPLKKGTIYEADLVGGKGHNLLCLINEGFAVPPGFIVTTKAFESFIKLRHFEADIRSLNTQVSLHDLQKRASIIRKKILQLPLPCYLQHELLHAVRRYTAHKFAVRSSMNIEDGAYVSFAGQFESYLGVADSAILRKIKQCWASAYSPRVIEYMVQNGIHPSTVRPGVIIQHMLEPDRAGVAFTQNVYNSSSNEMIIESVNGLGEQVVDGLVPPFQYIVDKKRHCVARRGDTKNGLLRSRELSKLIRLFNKVEQVFGYPQDIEWALFRTHAYILQSRPLMNETRQ